MPFRSWRHPPRAGNMVACGGGRTRCVHRRLGVSRRAPGRWRRGDQRQVFADRKQKRLLALQRSAGNAAVTRLLQRELAEVSTAADVLLEPLPISPPQMRVLGTYSDEQLSSALYGRPGVPIRYVGSDAVEISYSTLLPRWKPAFQEAVSGWEKTGPEERERVGQRAADGSIVWENRPRWTPVTDRSRGGMVVGFKRSSGGYTEVRNTAGDIVFVDEIPIEPLRIPIVDDIGDALKQAGYIGVGVVDAWLEDNWAALGLKPHEHPLASVFGISPDSLAYRIGRGGGHLVALLQAAAEIVGGAALIAGGAGEFVAGVATTPAGGVGLVIMPVAVVTIAAGTTVVVHGGALAGAVFMSAKDGGEGGGGGGKKPRGKWKITPERTAESARIAALRALRQVKERRPVVVARPRRSRRL